MLLLVVKGSSSSTKVSFHNYRFRKKCSQLGTKFAFNFELKSRLEFTVSGTGSNLCLFTRQWRHRQTSLTSSTSSSFDVRFIPIQLAAKNFSSFNLDWILNCFLSLAKHIQGKFEETEFGISVGGRDIITNERSHNCGWLHWFVRRPTTEKSKVQFHLSEIQVF